MALPTVGWDENSPLGSQALSLGDDRIREMKTQIREVIGVDHIFGSSGSSATTGMHNQVTLVEQASKPTTYTTNQIALYGKEVSSKTELFLVDEAGTEHQLTSNYLLNLATVSGTLAMVNGGLGLATLTLGDILYASASNTLSALAKNTTATRYLSNTGTSNIPAWSQINLINGVTIASQAQGDLLYADSSSTFARLGAGTSGQFLKTQGAGANPIWATIPGVTVPFYPTLVAVLIADGTVYDPAGNSYVKKFEATMTVAGTYTVKWQGIQADGSQNNFSKVYVNGIAVGAEKQTSGVSVNDFSEASVSIAANDLLQIYTKNTNPTHSGTAGVSYMVVYIAGSVFTQGTTYGSFTGGGTAMTTGRMDYSGTGVPPTVLGLQGDTYTRLDGGASTTLYIKTGASTWTAK